MCLQGAWRQASPIYGRTSTGADPERGMWSFMKTRIALKIRAGAPRTEFAGRLGNVWKLRVAAPPVDGKANEAIVRFLAKLVSLPPSAVRIVSGFAASCKIVEIEGIDSEGIGRAILESHGPRSHSGSSAPGKG